MSGPKVPFEINWERLQTWPVIAAVALNLIPVIGVVQWGWSAFALIFLYWLENVVIGMRTVASMIVSAVVGPGFGPAAGVFFAGFFTLHYGLFCFGHGTFVVALFGGAALGGHMFDLGGAMATLFARQPDLVIGLVSIVIWQIVLLGLFIAGGEVKRTNPLDLMRAPYPRIIVLHLVIIFGGFLLMLLNQPLAGLVLLALVKMAFDVAEALARKPLTAAANEP